MSDKIQLDRACCSALVVLLRDMAESEYKTARIHSNPRIKDFHETRAAGLARLADEIGLGMGGFEALHTEYLQWVKETFPSETPAEQFEHLREEVDELGKNMEDPDEYADVFMLLCCIAHGKGVNIVQAFRKKFEINKNRKWTKTERGFRHS